MKEHFCPVEQSTITYQGKCNWCGESEGSTNEIIEMARDSGMELYGLGKDRARFVHHLEAFANRVAAKEREAILPLLKGIDETEIESADGWWETSTGAALGAKILSTIRARGQA